MSLRASLLSLTIPPALAAAVVGTLAALLAVALAALAGL